MKTFVAVFVFAIMLTGRGQSVQESNSPTPEPTPMPFYVENYLEEGSGNYTYSRVDIVTNELVGYENCNRDKMDTIMRADFDSRRGYAVKVFEVSEEGCRKIEKMNDQ